MSDPKYAYKHSKDAWLFGVGDTGQPHMEKPRKRSKFWRDVKTIAVMAAWLFLYFLIGCLGIIGAALPFCLVALFVKWLFF